MWASPLLLWSGSWGSPELSQSALGRTGGAWQAALGPGLWISESFIYDALCEQSIWVPCSHGGHITVPFFYILLSYRVHKKCVIFLQGCHLICIMANRGVVDNESKELVHRKETSPPKTIEMGVNCVYAVCFVYNSPIKAYLSKNQWVTGTTNKGWNSSKRMILHAYQFLGPLYPSECTCMSTAMS